MEVFFERVCWERTIWEEELSPETTTFCEECFVIYLEIDFSFSIISLKEV